MRHRRLPLAAAGVALLFGSCSGQRAAQSPVDAASTIPAAAAPTSSSAPATPPPRPRLAILAHRGSTTSKISENGLPALMHAAHAGADMVEFDVRPSSDGRLVVMHDGGLARTSNCHGQVASRTLADIQSSCRLSDGSWVPSVEEWIDLAQRQGLPLMIELKSGPGWSPKVFDRFRELLGPLEDWRGTVFLSFDEKLLDLAHESMPALPGIWIVPRRVSSSRASSLAVLDKPVGGFLVDCALTSRGWVARAHRNGQLVYGRVVDTPTGWHRCRHIGLDGVLSNDLAGFLAWRSDLEH